MQPVKCIKCCLADTCDSGSLNCIFHYSLIVFLTLKGNFRGDLGMFFLKFEMETIIFLQCLYIYECEQSIVNLSESVNIKTIFVCTFL